MPFQARTAPAPTSYTRTSPTMSPGPSQNLPTLVQQKYESAKASSRLIFSPTSLTTISIANIPFQLRYCPALSQKPVSSNDSQKPVSSNPTSSRSHPPSQPPRPTTNPDPFASPPSALLIAQLPDPSAPSHILILNKYPVIASHFILATSAFKRQTDLLEISDLSVTFDCLRAWAAGSGGGHAGEGGAGAGAGNGKRLFAFFNSGTHSGASQAHRHVQFLPVEEMGGGDGVGEGGWRLLVDRMEDGGTGVEGEFCPESYGARNGSSGYTVRNVGDFYEHTADGARTLDGLSPRSLPQLPFVHFALHIPPDPSPEQLYDRYRRLYEMAVETCRSYAERHPEEDILVREGDRDECAAIISYNLALTTSCMVICPRRSEGAMLKAGEGRESGLLGPVAINGTILGGTLMVKTEEEWNEMRRDESSLYNLLQAVGIPIEHSPTNANGRL